ncbi:uncharacterized protein LOC127282046 [Leptopilina boulardi]|uniref:uncharacterized protein LOC127282046 n=1 Tax=Leptopilina boulardi TaxID=63433 RepID=UPI0021F657D2|nr:uncharacterized protein LOC127282046 [Leptopilina boulardi]
MNADQFSDILKDITKKFEDAFSLKSQQSRQEQYYNPKDVLKLALACVSNNTEELLIDVVEIITLFLIRGPKISKINESMKEIGKQRIDYLKKKYKLKDFASSEDVASGNALSLRKLIAAFPYQFLIIMKSEKYPRPLGKETLNLAKAQNFPGFLKSSTFLSVIPFPMKQNVNQIWSPDKEGITKFITIIHGVIAYEFLESFIVHKWGNNDTPISPIKALSNVISVAQNILHSNFINQKIREDNYLKMFEKDVNLNFKAIENLVAYTENKYNGFNDILFTHFNYNIKSMKFDCRAKVFCRHVER